jgi:hypothetical protein
MDLFAESRDLSGLEMLRKMIADGRGPPIAATLKFTLGRSRAGRPVFRATPGPHAYNPIGVITAATPRRCSTPPAAAPCTPRSDAGQAYTTLELKVAYHRAITNDTGAGRSGRHRASAAAGASPSPKRNCSMRRAACWPRRLRRCWCSRRHPARADPRR